MKNNQPKIVATLALVALFLMPFSTISATGVRSNTTDMKKSTVSEQDYVPGEVIVKYRNDKLSLSNIFDRSRAEISNTRRSLKAKSSIEKMNTSLLEITDKKASVLDKVKELRNDPNVEYAEPNYKKQISTISTNDTSRANLWGLDNTGQTVNGTVGTADKDIDAPEAWAINEGTNATVTVAVLDTGVAYSHPDLAANMWDGSSCKDYYGDFLGGCSHGYDFQDDDKYPLPTDSYHGTHVAGTIAAVKNNAKGMIGVAPRAKIMALKFGMDTYGEVMGILFAIENGAMVMNASFGGSYYSSLEYAAIDMYREAGGIFVAAAGNGGSDGVSDNNELSHSYPSDYTLDNIISVAATTQTDALASFSNYGATSVDVGAPGTNIYSSVPLETFVTGSNAAGETFESLTAPAIPSGWVETGNWGTYDIGGAWGNVLYGDLAYPTYASNANTTITSSTKNLTGGGASINFWTMCDTEYPADVIWPDYMQLEYSSDGVNFTAAPSLYPDEPDYPTFRWSEPMLDALNGGTGPTPSGSAIYNFSGITIPDQYRTANFKFRFRWVTNSTDNTHDGCLVDDVSITKYSNGSEETYKYLQGTSMAAPHVAGLAALIKGYNPALKYSRVKDIILTSGDDIASLHNKTTSGRRINAYNALVAADPTNPINFPTTPVYRFWSNTYHGHFYTTSSAEKDYIIAYDPNWVYEGSSFNSFSSSAAGRSPVYRFWSDNYKHHFFTISESEKNSVIANDPNWSYEGIAYYGYSSSQPSSTALYRFWSDNYKGHFYTSSSAEKNSIIANDPNWRYESTAYYIPN